MRKLLLTALALGTFGALPASAQHTVATEVHFLGYSFQEDLGPEVANLVLFPVAYRTELFEGLSLDVYSAWGQGQVEQDNTVFKLAGVVDSRIRLDYRARDWASVSVSFNLPTGNQDHTDEEAFVAAVLSSDLLGFRESTFGGGYGMNRVLGDRARRELPPRGGVRPDRRLSLRLPAGE